MDEVTWFWKSNVDPWSTDEIDEWTPFTDVISNQIERAYQVQTSELIIDERHKILFNQLLQVDIQNLNRQRPIRRYSTTEGFISYYRRERFTFTQPIRRSILDDTPNYGCRFITDWLIAFTKGTLKIRSPWLIEVLIDGIRIEGEKLNLTRETQDLITEIRLIKKKKIDKLQRCCARLYSKPCFLFKLVNRTLRDDDRSKLMTLGPFCYLLYNYIGIRHNEYLSVRDQWKQFVQPTVYAPVIIVYRGEALSPDHIETYRQAVGQGYFYKWSSFISTSRSRSVAEMFGSNVLYIITIKRKSSNDQYVDLVSIAYIKDEQEILLRPGVRFKIDQTEDDPRTGRCVFHIQIVPSFISNLM